MLFTKCAEEPLNVPVAAVALAARVNVLVVVVGLGTNPVTVTPLGRLLALKVTLPLKPLTGLTVMVLVPLLPCAMLVGVALRLKFGLPEQPAKMKLPTAV